MIKCPKCGGNSFVWRTITNSKGYPVSVEKCLNCLVWESVKESESEL